MALSIFIDKEHPPETAEIEAALGTALPNWTALVDFVTDRYAPVTAVWNHAGAKFGWSLRLKRRDRVVLYLTPQRSMFLVGIVLGEKAVAAALEAGLPTDIASALDAAPRYAEGRGVRIGIGEHDDLEGIRMLVTAKMGGRM